MLRFSKEETHWHSNPLGFGGAFQSPREQGTEMRWYNTWQTSYEGSMRHKGVGPLGLGTVGSGN